MSGEAKPSRQAGREAEPSPKAEPSRQASREAEPSRQAGREAEASPKAEPSRQASPGAEGPPTRTARANAKGRLFGLLNLGLLLVVAVLVNYLAARHYRRWDWTTHSIYTLSERSLEVVEGLEQDVEIWLFMSPREPEYRTLYNLLTQYESRSERVSLRTVDPDLDPERDREATRRFGLGRALVEDDQEVADVAAVVATRERHWKITRDDLVRPRFDLMAENPQSELRLDVESEQAVTGALVEITTGRPTRICLTQGHGEFDLSGGAHSLGALRDELRRENLELTPIETRGTRQIPERCDAVAIVGPEVAFSSEEVNVLREMLRRGGNLLVALDPIPSPDRSSLMRLGLETMLAEFGIRVENALVVELDPAFQPGGVGHPIAGFLAAELTDHPVTERLRGQPVFFSEARALRVVDGQAEALAHTSEQSYAETDLRSLQGGEPLAASDGDLPGPVVLAAAAQLETEGAAGGPTESAAESAPRGGRVVVFGDASLFSSTFMTNPALVNRLLVSAAVGWLSDREALLAIPPRTVERRPFSMTEADVWNLGLRVIALIPLAFVFLGIGVWWNRRS